MKSVLKITKLLGLVIALSLNITQLKAQCNSTDYAETCISSLDSTYNFIKSFTLDGQQGAAEFVEHSYVLTQDTEYMINWCSQNQNDSMISLEVLDQNRVSIANSANNEESGILVFTCLATGIYYLKYSFNDSEESCGGSAMGFKQP